MQLKYKKITRRKSSKRTTRKSRINKNKSSKTRRTARRTYRTKRRHTKNKIHRKYKGGCGGQGRGLGQAWNGGDIAKLPGVSGPHDGNYYEYKGVPSGLYDPPMPSNSQFQNNYKPLNLDKIHMKSINSVSNM